MRRFIFFIISCTLALAGCGGIEMNIKDSYVYNPVSHIKCKYPLNVSLEVSFSSDNIILKDDILDICLKELEAKKIFASVTKKNDSKNDVIIELKFSDYKNKKDTGLMVNISVKQLPDKKLIYKKKILQPGTDENFKNPDLFADLLKNLITAFMNDIDVQFKQFTNEGNLPRNLCAKNVICAVFQFKDSVENETYGEAVTSLIITNLTKTESIKVVERDRIVKVVKEFEFKTTALSDPKTVKQVGQFLDADFLLYGEITKIKDTYHIAMHIIDVKLCEIVLSRSMETGDPDKFSTLIQQHANYIAQFISK